MECGCNGRYCSISTQIIGQIKNVRVPFNVDIGVGDVIVPKQNNVKSKRSFQTLQRRGTPYDRDSFKRIIVLADDEDMQKRWKYFLKNIEDDTLEFSVVIAEIQIFLEPVFDAMVKEEDRNMLFQKAKENQKRYERLLRYAEGVED